VWNTVWDGLMEALLSVMAVFHSHYSTPTHPPTTTTINNKYNYAHEYACVPSSSSHNAHPTPLLMLPCPR